MFKKCLWYCVVASMACGAAKGQGQQADNVINSFRFSSEIKEVKFTKGKVGEPLQFHTMAGFRTEHLQDIIRLPDKNGKQYYMGTFSQDTSDTEGGMVFVGEHDPSGSSRIIWLEELNMRHVAGGYNHPCDLRRIGDMVVIAGQNWDENLDGYDKDRQHVLFYDVTDPTKPKYRGKMNSARTGRTEVKYPGQIDNVMVWKAGGYYYLAFGRGPWATSLVCRSRQFLPREPAPDYRQEGRHLVKIGNATQPKNDWELVSVDHVNTCSPVAIRDRNRTVFGAAKLEDGYVNVYVPHVESLRSADWAYKTGDMWSVERRDVLDLTAPSRSSDRIPSSKYDGTTYVFGLNEITFTGGTAALGIGGGLIGAAAGELIYENAKSGTGTTSSISVLADGKMCVVYGNARSSDTIDIQVVESIEAGKVTTGRYEPKPITGLYLLYDWKSKSPPPGYHRINVDLNAGAGGADIQLCYSTKPSEGRPITNIIVFADGTDQPRPTGALYRPVPNNDPKGSGDLNRDAGGADVYMYYSRAPKEAFAGNPISHVDVVVGPREGGGWVRNKTDLNAGAGGADLYLRFTRN